MISRGTRGAISELVATTYYLDAGWSVFRSESPNAPFDLAIYKAGRLLRVEVKTVTTSVGTVLLSWPRNEEWDLLAIVHDTAGWVTDYAAGMSRSEVAGDLRTRLGFGHDTPVLMPCGATVIHTRRHVERCAACKTSE